MKVHFGLDPQKRKELVGLLSKSIANTYALYFNTLNCHWNLEDPRFLFLHQMLESQYEKLAENGDALAERVRQMGEKIATSLHMFVKHSEIDPIDEYTSGDRMLSLLADSHEKIIHDLRILSDRADEYKDYGLVDLLGGILRDHEKTAWFIRSHLNSFKRNDET